MQGTGPYARHPQGMPSSSSSPDLLVLWKGDPRVLMMGLVPYSLRK